MDAAAAAIRAFEPGDLDRLEEIREAAFAPIFASFRRILGPAIADVALASAEAEQAALLARLCDPESSEEMVVAVAAGEVVGFAALSLGGASGVGEIGLNAVHPDHAGRGIGTALYAHLLERMRAAGMRVATVATGGDPSHAPARRAYEKAGFGPSLPSVWLCRAL